MAQWYSFFFFWLNSTVNNDLDQCRIETIYILYGIRSVGKDEVHIVRRHFREFIDTGTSVSAA